MAFTANVVVVAGTCFVALTLGRLLGVCTVLLIEVLVPALRPCARHRAKPVPASGAPEPRRWMRPVLLARGPRRAQEGQPVAA